MGSEALWCATPGACCQTTVLGTLSAVGSLAQRWQHSPHSHLLTCLEHVTGCSRYVGHNGPVCAGPTVKQAALANIGTPNNCYLQKQAQALMLIQQTTTSTLRRPSRTTEFITIETVLHMQPCCQEIESYTILQICFTFYSSTQTFSMITCI